MKIKHIVDCWAASTEQEDGLLWKDGEILELSFTDLSIALGSTCNTLNLN